MFQLAAMAWKDKTFMYNFGGRLFLEDCDVDFPDFKKTKQIDEKGV